MKILKLLNKKSFSILIVCFCHSFQLTAEEKPIDIWQIEKKENNTELENATLNNKIESLNQNSVYKLQANKDKDSIKLF